MSLDIKKGLEILESDVERHNKIFMFKMQDRIEAIDKKMKRLGRTKYKYPITKDEDGRLMWMSRGFRRKNNIR